MSNNRPTINTNEISMGPAVVFLGPAGATPSVDVGAVAEDASVTFEFADEKVELRQGNPALLELMASSKQDFRVRVTSHQWDMDLFNKALGTATTSADGDDSILEYGGKATVASQAMHIRHYMAQPGHTVDLYVWEVYPESGFNQQFTQEFHSREMVFLAKRSSQNWAGSSLANGKELLKMVIDKS